MHLVVFACIFHDVVGLQCAGVDTPFAVEGYDSVAGLCPLRRHHDHTVRTACAVQCIRGSVLEYTDGLDIGSIDVVDVAFEGNTVDNPERVVLGVHRTVTADVNLLTGTRTARFRGELHTGDFADECILDVRGLCFDQVVGFDNLRRSGKRIFFGCTEGDHDHIVDCLRIFFQRDVDARFS